MSEQSLDLTRRTPLPWSDIGRISYDPVFEDKQRFDGDRLPGSASLRPVLETDPSGFEAELGTRKVGLMIGQPVHLQTGRPFLLPSVGIAFDRLAEGLKNGSENAGYREPVGDPAFRAAIMEYALGKTGPGTDLPSVACIHTEGGTNAVRRAIEFICAKVPKFPYTVYAPKDRWVGHNGIVRDLGVQIIDYPVLNPETAALDGDRISDAWERMPDRSVAILSFENPGGLVPPTELLRQLQQIALRKGIIALVDTAYQGLMVGEREDCEVMRSFMRAGVPTIGAYSGGKAFTLTGARIGALFIAANDAQHLAEIQDYVGHEVNRPDFTHASVLGAHVVRILLTNPELRAQHTDELTAMRVALKDRGDYFLRMLREFGLPESFSLPETSLGLFRPLPWLGPKRVAALNALGTYPLDNRVTIMAPETWLHYAARGIAKVAREVQEDTVPTSAPNLMREATLPRPRSDDFGFGPLCMGC